MDLLGQELLRQARAAINGVLNNQPCPDPLNESITLQSPGASFVSLYKQGTLRGCIGTLDAARPLLEDVRSNAIAAAFRDQRFYPVEQAELLLIKIEVSLLSPPQALHFNDEAHLLSQLKPDRDGIILRCGRHQATFLPQVWKQLPNPADFLHHLKLKSGLPANTAIEQFDIARYQVQQWIES